MPKTASLLRKKKRIDKIIDWQRLRRNKEELEAWDRDWITMGCSSWTLFLPSEECLYSAEEKRKIREERLKRAQELIDELD